MDTSDDVDQHDWPVPGAVASAFGLVGRVGSLDPVGGAWSNQAFRLDVGDDAFAIKVILNPWELPEWFDRLDEAWIVEQAAIAAGVAAPQPVPNPVTGGWRADVERAGGGGSAPVRAHRWLDGRPAPIEPASEPLARWCGATMATIHRLALQPTRPEVFPARDAGSAHRWPELLDQIASARVTWEGLARNATAAVREIAELHRAAVEEPMLMGHRDIDQKNILLDGVGPALCDWDVAGPVRPRAEVADVAVSMARWERWGIARATIDAYRQAGGEIDAITPVDLAPMLLSGLDWIVMNIDRSLGADRSPADRALGTRLAPELLGALPGRVATAMRIGELLAPAQGSSDR